MGRSGKSPANEFKVGDLAEFLINEVDNEKQTISGTLSQVPEVQAAIVSLNAKTGEIVAMVGGYDFHTSKFNNATQGLRQTGSCYKPFVYTAAVEAGMTPESIVSGAPIKRGGWSPSNYGGSKSHGNVPMKVALAKSYNIAAVHLLDQVGIQAGAQMVRRFGITNPMAPSLPSALGASEASLLEMVSAYSVFPNKGMRVQPHLIRKVMNRDGSLLEEWGKTTYRVTSEYVALTMVEMMRGVVSGGGTAGNANAAGHPLAGKTGTVNDETDVWFIGYTPTYVTGVWMGNPLRKESLGKGMTGGHGALPYFNAFMSQFMKDKKRETFEDAPPIPSDIKALIERKKREEQEKLDIADENGRRTGITFTPTRRTNTGTTTTTTTDSTVTETGETGGDTTTVKPQGNPTPAPRNNDTPKNPVPQNTPVKKPETQQEKPTGTQRKGKKGGGDN
jgi:penicillin-binding protein 1A